MDNLKQWLWLTVKVNLPAKIVDALIKHFGSIEDLYAARPNDFLRLTFLSDTQMSKLADKDLSGIDDFISVLSENNVKIITIDSEEYPNMLKYVANPPNVLYCRGRFINLNSHLCISIVGARRPTEYGTHIARELARDVAKRGVIVVSGMADGIDASAHIGALDAKMPTVAVLGCGVNRVYPACNRALMQQIMQTGMVVSEYAPNTEPAKHHFPQRNRIIAGMSVGTVVVEADLGSGSLITSRIAWEYGRDVFAVPGNINSMRSKGTNRLLKDGAIVVTEADDITEPYKSQYSALLNTPFDELDTPADEDIEEPPADVTEIEKRILSVLDGEPKHIDKISHMLDVDITQLNSPLLRLELAGKIYSYPGNCYCLSTKSN